MKRVTQQGMAVINALVVVMAVSIATMGIVQRQSG
ncbi:type II secretion system minor pseudopilin GspK, partial [Alcaligenes pakistanensis]